MKKRKIILIILVTIVLSISIGFSLSVFTYNKLGSNQQLILGEIYMKYNELNTLMLENMMPSKTSDPNKYFEFQVTGVNTSEQDIIYNIKLSKGDLIINKARIKDKFVKFKLTEVISNTETVLVDNINFQTIDNNIIYTDKIAKNIENETTKKYRLYIWISDAVGIGNTDIVDYQIDEWNNLFASIKVNITGDYSI